MMMRVPALLALLLAAALAPSCKSHKAQPLPPPSEPLDIPREAALEKLRGTLPTAEYTYCTLPKHTIKQTEIHGFTIRNEGFEIDHGREKKLTLSYVDITAVKLELIGKYYTVRIYTTVQTEKDKDHFGFQWRQEEPAKRAVELLLSLKSK
jgi:hypothetical protein